MEIVAITKPTVKLQGTLLKQIQHIVEDFDKQLNCIIKIKNKRVSLIQQVHIVKNAVVPVPDNQKL